MLIISMYLYVREVNARIYNAKRPGRVSSKGYTNGFCDIPGRAGSHVRDRGDVTCTLSFGSSTIIEFGGVRFFFFFFLWVAGRTFRRQSVGLWYGLS